MSLGQFVTADIEIDQCTILHKEKDKGEAWPYERGKQRPSNMFALKMS